ncbi:MAG: tRNA 2-thiouridine(34) synthase MnmA [Acholeplasmatales bacterium]|jgi:tRNA-specific 2-thiouridylase|nr:tRNA 2-thiouridine(34) synthase MnmA [Acholeplasmatales bacterium]
MERVILGLSGGVDSAVAAYLLKKQGYEVIGVFMRNWDSLINNDISGNPQDFNDICPQEQDYMDAVKVATELGIELLRVDFIKEYWDNVFTYFLNEYKNNRTPNPDVLCNNEIKFKAFIKYAQTLNYDYIAMGHYAKIEVIDNVRHLAKAFDTSKDQSYFLSQLTKEQLSKVIFPLENLTKTEVRKIALDNHLAVATKKDSTGICFIGERDFNKFLDNYLPSKKGDIRRMDGSFIKTHEGLMYYTIGQRKGLGIGGSNKSLEPYFVVGKDVKNNTLYVEPGSSNIYLLSNNAIIKDVIWRFDNKEMSGLCAKFRYRQADIKVTIKWINDNSFHIFYDDLASVTPGQVCAIYYKNICVGSGFIDSVYYNNDLRVYING